jgi:cob(I)alamin adenosyltransferase
MKKFLKKVRLLINLWSIRQQIRITETMLDHIEKDISCVSKMVELIQDFIPNSRASKKLAKLEAVRKTHVETLGIYRNQAQKIRQDLAA